jgi:hypothetical protein
MHGPLNVKIAWGGVQWRSVLLTIKSLEILGDAGSIWYC